MIVEADLRAKVLWVVNSFDPGGAEHGLLTLLDAGFFSTVDFSVFAFCKGRGTLITRITKAADVAEVKVVNDDEQLRTSHLLKGAFELTRWLAAEQPHFVVLSLKQANVVGRIVLTAFPKIRCIAFEHIAKYRAAKFEWLYGALLKMLSPRVDEIWADARETLRATERYFVDNGKRLERVVPLFCADFDVAQKTDYRLGKPIRIVGCGRLVQRKRFGDVIGVIGELRSEGYDLSFDLFGDGPETPLLESEIRARGLEKNVCLLGYREQWYVEASRYDLFVNFSDMEGFCIVVAEAMLVGLPVIATLVGGVRDYAKDGVNIKSVQPGDVQGLRRAITEMVADMDKRQKLGTQASQLIREEYKPATVSALGREVFDRPRRGSRV
ncbi:glycosyltransferase [Methylolobus aquaticus]|nr:glycosyltransferase [Methylolobus aquaticus]